MPNSLRSNPMFRLSMSSLELFHSNFLEWLFDLDHEAFLKCFDLTVSNPAACTIEREYHLGTTPVNGKNKQWVTDIAVFENGNLILIIENKFKSITFAVNHIDDWRALVGDYDMKKDTNDNTYYIDLAKCPRV